MASMNPLHDVNVNITDAVRMNKCFFFIAQYILKFNHCIVDSQQQRRSDDGRQSKVPLDDALQPFPEVPGFGVAGLTHIDAHSSCPRRMP
jgi:hypothetical protein